MAKYTQGIYKPVNPKKFIGNVKNITYRSSWELKYLFYLDTNPNVIAIGSEEIIIPYYDIKGKLHRYFMDLYVKRKVEDEIIEELIEIKPFAQTIPPVLSEGSKKKTKINQVLTYDINQRKWAAARKYCEKKGWEFRIVTEKDHPAFTFKKF